MYAGGQSRGGNGGGGGGDGGRDALLRRRKQPPGPSPPSPSSPAAAASSSSGRGEEAEEEGGGKTKKLWRRRRQGKAVLARAIRDGLPAAAASCWRGVSVVEETAGRRSGRGRSRRRDSTADGSGPGEDCSLEPNPSANGKEEPGVRSLLERNDFFAADCNPHADGLPSSSSSSSCW